MKKNLKEIETQEELQNFFLNGLNDSKFLDDIPNFDETGKILFFSLLYNARKFEKIFQWGFDYFKNPEIFGHRRPGLDLPSLENFLFRGYRLYRAKFYHQAKETGIYKYIYLNKEGQLTMVSETKNGEIIDKTDNITLDFEDFIADDWLIDFKIISDGKSFEFLRKQDA